METVKCYGKTRSGYRCTNNAKYTTNSFNTPFPACGLHRQQNVVYTWCDPDANNETIPEKVFNLMCLYGRCFYTFNLNPSLSCLISSKLHDHEQYQSLSKEDTLETFFDLFFIESKNGTEECPICYNHKKSVKMPTCEHLICKDCICTWTLKTANCPMCREEFLKG